MKKELKIGEKFKIFYGSTYTLKHDSSIQTQSGTAYCNFSFTFLVEIDEEFINNESEISYEYKEKLIKDFFKSCYYKGISITGVYQIDTDNYYSSGYYMTIHCNGKLGIHH